MSGWGVGKGGFKEGREGDGVKRDANINKTIVMYLTYHKSIYFWALESKNLSYICILLQKYKAPFSS